MADFRQLALEFVLSDDESKLSSNARAAATDIQTAPSSSNPVARWVEAVQPWMPGANGEDLNQDGEQSTNWTARAKALEFLSRTLDFLGKDVLKPSQVKLLVSFFGAMFEVDHKAGILPSATSLSRIVAMKSFQAQSGDEIIQKICLLKDDFPRQVAKTRLAVYELLRALITSPDVSGDLQTKHGVTAEFMIDLIQLCQSERDPDCLIVWFDILTHFLSQYDCSQKMSDEVYGAFKAYFPISLPRNSQSGLTPEELKLQLRKCFCANRRLAKSVFPFLIGKLDQGDGVTVNVKIDILKTIQACVETYEQPELSVTPYVNQIWGSLKYEVRNGEIEDTIWATLEVLKALAMRLKYDDLRDYTLNVTRDCVNDLSNPIYTAPAGRLLVSVLSASPRAFVLVAAPTITHVKENLRHPKSPTHSQDLLKVLHIVLETRLMLLDTDMTPQDASDFNAIDPIIGTLYNEVYKAPLDAESMKDAVFDVQLSVQAVQGAGALVCQRPVKPESSNGVVASDESTYSKICLALTRLAIPSKTGAVGDSGSDELINEALKALQRAIKIHPPKFKSLVDSSMAIIRPDMSNSTPNSSNAVQSYCSLLPFIGCSELPSSPLDGLNQYVYYMHRISRELSRAIDTGAHPKALSAMAASIQSAARYFNEACLNHGAAVDSPLGGDMSVAEVLEKYPLLSNLDDDLASTSTSEQMAPSLHSESVTGIRNDFLLVSLMVAKYLYGKVTRADGTGRLTLSDKIDSMDGSSRFELLHLLSGFAGFVIHELNEKQQVALHTEKLCLNLFHDDLELTTKDSMASSSESQPVEPLSKWSWLVLGNVNILSFGPLEALRPSVVGKLFESGIAQEVILSAVSPATSETTAAQPVAMSIMAILANKCKIESSGPLLETLESHLKQALQDSERGLGKAMLIFSVANGLFRRYTGKQTEGLIAQLRETPTHPTMGHRLARRLEMVAAPHASLTKANYAVLRPLWMQKIYFQLVKPMLQVAVGNDPSIQDALTKTNFSIAVLAMTKHMTFSIYEADADKVLLISIAVAQNIGKGPDVQSALDVMQSIIIEASDKAQDHLRSIVNISIDAFSSSAAASSKQAPSWLPPDYVPSAGDPESQAACGKLALEIVGGLPRIFETRHLVPFAPQVQRELTVACGHKVRDVRRTARLARAAWVDLR